ncbi:MAG: hypothetical protein H7A53_03010 [Akkermansiaceae bacterium]|nr:hypothetical protein [Akkermansiaceae bacterium]
MIGFKGMLTTDQLLHYFPDFHHPDMQTSMALVHSRFSTNTFPSWPRAQPFRHLPQQGRSAPCGATKTGCTPARRGCGRSVRQDVKKTLPIISGEGSIRNADGTGLPRDGRPLLPHAV